MRTRPSCHEANPLTRNNIFATARFEDIVKRLLAAFLLLASSTGAATRFVTPQENAQLFGLTLVEIETSIENADRVELYVDGALAGVARSAPWRLAYDFGEDLRSRTLTAKVWSGGFSTSEDVTIRSASASMNDTLTVDLVEVPMRVRARGVLRAADLRIVENGVEQQVREITMERPPAHFAFVVDRSLSMGDGRLTAALAAIERELVQLRAGDTASLVLFNHQVLRAIEIKPGHPVVAADVVPSGGTSLRDALASASSARRTYAIVITDGGDRNSELSEEEALQRISGAKTVVNAIVTGGSHARFLDRAAANTGGAVVTANREGVGMSLARLLADINSRHLVVYQSSAEGKGWRRIEVKGRKRGVDVVAARKGYFAE